MRAPIITEIMRGHGLGEYETRYVNIMDPPFRARGDGIIDNTDVIQAAIDINPQGIYIPQGVFVCNLTVDGAVNIFGMGPKSVLLAKTSAPVITVTERLTEIFTGQGPAMGRRFDNFTICGNAKIAKGIFYSDLTVEEEIVAVYFDNCTRGIDFGLLGAIGNTVRYCNFVTCDYGVYAKDSGPSAMGLNLNLFTENRFRSIALCGVYLNGSVLSCGGNEFIADWFEGIAGFAIILKGESVQGAIRYPNSLRGGWFEAVAPAGSSPVTLDDEGATATRVIWLKDASLVATGGKLPGDVLVEDGKLNVDYYRGCGVHAGKNQIVSLGKSEIIINDAIFDQQSGTILIGVPESSLVVKRPHSFGGDNRGFLVEGLPMDKNISGHTNLTGIQDLVEFSGSVLTYQNAQYLGSGVLRCQLSDDTERAISGTLSISNDKFYAFSFSIRSSTSSAEEDMSFEISGTGDLFTIKTIMARGDRWTHYAGLVWSGDTAPTNQVLKFKTSDAATFDISRLQLVEFSTLIAAEAFLHNQQYAITPKYSTLENNATPPVVSDELHSYWLTGDTTGITDFDQGFIGQMITVLAEHNKTITDGAPIILSGSANFDMVLADTLTLINKADGNWYEIGRGDN